MHKFERKYAFWFDNDSTSMYSGEVLDIRQDCYLIKPSNNSCPSIIVKEVFIIVPYIDGIRIQKDLNKEVIK